MSYSRLIISVVMILTILGLGTVHFHYAEQWSWVDAFYFTGMTVTTVGYGDLTPTTPQTKLFIVFYTILTIGVFLYSLTVIGEEIFKKRFENMFSFINKMNGRKRKNPQTTLFQHFK